MRIIDNAAASVEFSTIKVGECFYYDNSLFIKIEPVVEVGYKKPANALCFTDNRITEVPANWNVIPVEADIVVRNKGVE